MAKTHLLRKQLARMLDMSELNIAALFEVGLLRPQRSRGCRRDAALIAREVGRPCACSGARDEHGWDRRGRRR